eukprot:4490038-Pyramimonas_sp.AAC.1
MAARGSGPEVHHLDDGSSASEDSVDGRHRASKSAPRHGSASAERARRKRRSRREATAATLAQLEAMPTFPSQERMGDASLAAALDLAPTLPSQEVRAGARAD